MLFFTKMATGCIHLEKYKQGDGKRNFQMIHAIFVVRATAEARRTKVSSLICWGTPDSYATHIAGGKCLLLHL